MPKGHPIAVKRVPWHISVSGGNNLRPAPRAPGYWNLYPEFGTTPRRTMIPTAEAARLYPEAEEMLSNLDRARKESP